MARGRKPTPEGMVAELYGLLEEIAADGVITNEEANLLHEWLLDNRDAGIPSFEFLRGLLDQFLADGKITEPERKAIHAAVEKVLPVELRQASRLARTSLKLREKAAAENAKETERAKRPIHIADFMVAGVRYDNRASVISRYLIEGQRLYLVREPSNSHDANAILIRTHHGYDIGYVPREDAAEIAPLLDSGETHAAECKKILDGRNYPIPVVYAQVFRADQQIPNTVNQSQVPSSAAAPGSATVVAQSGCGKGCVTLLSIAFGLVVLFILIISSRTTQ